MPRNRVTLFLTSALIALLTFSGAAAGAAENESDVRLYLKIDGKLVQAAPELFDFPDLAEPATKSRDTSPYLISFDQWVRCFTLNMEEDVYRSYTYYWNGGSQTARLKCGDGSWGYKHIRAGKESNWQSRLDLARANGWDSQSQGVESWDDLMAGVTAHAITYAQYGNDYPAQNKRCGTNEVYFMNTSTGEIVYSFWVVAAWATDKERVITSFSPSSAAYSC